MRAVSGSAIESARLRKASRTRWYSSHADRQTAQAARLSLHVDASGRDAHHVAEAAFKATGRALRAAVREQGEGVPSTKGLL